MEFRLLYNTEAIVVRNIAYGEAHAIVTLLTPSGLVAAMARGAKKPQSRLAAGVQLVVEGMYTLYRKSGMGTLSQLEITNSRRSLREHLLLAAYAAYFCELVSAVAEEAPNGSEVVYRSFQAALNRLEACVEKPPVTARIWETKVLRMLGASPNWMECVACHSDVESSGAYSMVDGGFLCKACTERMVNVNDSRRPILFVPGVVPKVLKSFETVPFERVGRVSLSSATFDGMKKVLEIQLREFAGLSLKSKRFLDSIDEVFPEDTNFSE